MYGPQGSLGRAETERPRIEAELASAEHQLRETTAAIDRYLQAFETGANAAETCGERIDHLSARRAELAFTDMSWLRDSPTRPRIPPLKAA